MKRQEKIFIDSRRWRLSYLSVGDRKSPEKDVGGARRRAQRARLPLR
jgi:hypothetical protein